MPNAIVDQRGGDDDDDDYGKWASSSVLVLFDCILMLAIAAAVFE